MKAITYYGIRDYKDVGKGYMGDRNLLINYSFFP